MIIEQNSTAPGTHPSWASHMMRVKCDMCGETWLADSCCDGVYSHSLDGTLGYHVDGEDFCPACWDEINEG